MKNIINRYAAALVFIAAIAAPAMSSAQTLTVAELQAQIQALLAQLQQLQAQLAQVQGGAAFCHTFNTNLGIGDRGDEVAALDAALGKEGFNPGEAPSVYDEQKASAVTGFQEKYKDEILTPIGLKFGTGYVGKLTRAKLNQLFGCGVTQPPTPPPADQPSVTVFSPNGGETLTPGQRHSIRWAYTGDLYDPNLVSSFYIYLMEGSTVRQNIVFALTTCERYECEYAWTVPSIFGGNFKIKVWNTVNGVEDQSDAPFTIASSPTVITQPSISSLAPSSGPVGASVLITGSGFSTESGGNAVKFGSGYVKGLTSLDGQTLKFIVPSGLDLCPPTFGKDAPQYCALGFPQVTPGTYAVAVVTKNGTSNSSNFTVTPVISPAITASLTGYISGSSCVTNSSSECSYQNTGNSYTLILTSNKPNTSFQFCSTQTGNPSGYNHENVCADVFPTDGSGSYTKSGNWLASDPSVPGAWQQWVQLGSYKSPIIKFTVNNVVPGDQLSASPSSLSFTTAQYSTPPQQSLTLTNNSSQTVTWSVGIISAPNWLSTYGSAGTIPPAPYNVTSLPVNVNASGLSAGTYNGTLTFTGNFTGSPKTVPVTLTVTATPTPAPLSTAIYTIIDTTTNANVANGTAKLGDSFKLDVATSPAIAGKAVYVCIGWWPTAATGFTQGCSYYGATNNNGYWTGTGSWPAGNTNWVGSWSEYAEVRDGANIYRSPNVGFTLVAPTTAAPAISATPTSLSFSSAVGTAPPSKTFTIQNSGTATANWSIVNNYVGATVTPLSGSLAPGASQAITVYLAAPTTAGTFNGTITVTGNFTSVPISIIHTVTSVVSPFASLSLYANSYTISSTSNFTLILSAFFLPNEQFRLCSKQNGVANPCTGYMPTNSSGGYTWTGVWDKASYAGNWEEWVEFQNPAFNSPPPSVIEFTLFAPTSQAYSLNQMAFILESARKTLMDIQALLNR